MCRSILVIAAATLLALAPAAAAAPPAFTSAYTDLNKDCKAALKESEVGEGQDMPMKCKGYGGYFISIGYSAMASHVGVQREGDGDSLIGLINAGIGYSEEPGRKVEWRMADGKPFAVIIRATSYDVPKAEAAADSPYQDKYKTGETLVVKGLKGYEHIDFTVDASQPNANEKAREMADGNYARK